jgi:nitroreductase
MLTANARTADHDVEALFLERWSPRAFTGEPISDEALMSIFEAARWAPSSYNMQPWRFVYARRDSAEWPKFLGLLVEFNQMWASNASALVFVISDKFQRKPDAAPAPSYSHSFDAGAAWAQMALQAHALGWATHGMTGFDVEKSYAALGVPPEDYRIEAAVAIGKPGDKNTLPEFLQAREQPSGRNPIAALIHEGSFKV